MLRFQLLQLAKFSGVLLFVGGATASFIAREGADRTAAVHRIGSIGLLLTWGAGYLLASTLGWSPSQLWIVAGFATTLAIHLVLTWSAARDHRRHPRAAALVALLFLATLALMIWKPTWQLVR